MNQIDRRDFIKIGTGTASAILLSSQAAAGYFASVRPDADPVPTAVIGCGRQGRLIMGELGKFPFVKMTAVCDVVEGRLKSARRRARGAKTYTDYRELLDKEKDLEAVVNATPTHLHADIATACLEQGKHVYCEAPMATTIEDCRKIAAAAKKASSVFHVGLQSRSNPIYKLARTFVRSGTLRDIVDLNAQYSDKTSWRIPASDPARDRALNWRVFEETSIGLEGEIGSHQFDVICWFINKLPLSVSGSGSIMCYKDGRDVADTVQCQLRFPDDLDMTYRATLASSYGGRREEMIGTMGAVRLIGDFGWLFKEADAPTQGWEVYAVKQYFHKEEGITLIADATKLAKQGKLKEGVGLPHPPIYYGLESFLKSVIEEKPSTSPAPLGLRAAVIGIKAHEAVATGSEIVFKDEWFKIG